VAWGVVDVQAQAGQLDHLTVGQLTDVVGLLELEPAEGGPGLGAEPGQGVGEQVPVGRVDEGRDVAGAGQRGHRPDVVEVAVGEQGRHRLEAVAAAQLVDPGQGVLAGVDDQGLGAGAVATSQQFVWKVPAGNPVTSMAACYRNGPAPPWVLIDSGLQLEREGTRCRSRHASGSWTGSGPGGRPSASGPGGAGRCSPTGTWGWSWSWPPWPAGCG
jgi:hypothetical protein